MQWMKDVSNCLFWLLNLSEDIDFLLKGLEM